MKPRQLISLFVLLITACAGSGQPTPTASPTSVSLPPMLTAIPNESHQWEIYSSDPQHRWNRLFRQFFARTASDGVVYGWDSLDPLLWPDTTYLLEGQSYQQAIQLLDEFLSSRGEELIRDPLKRAMFQRDMWSVFDWLSFRYDDDPINHPAQRQALQNRIAKVIQRLALTKDEILSLPDNYTASINSRAFAPAFQNEQTLAPFLPADLYSPDSGWIGVGRQGGPIAMTHTQEFPFLGRSVFLVYIRVPEDKDATLYLLRAMNTEPTPDLPHGTEVALVRRALLIDNEDEIILSPIVLSVQVRHFKFSSTQYFYEFQANRLLLFTGVSGGFQPVKNELMLFRTHGDVFQIGDTNNIDVQKAQIPSTCFGCHIDELQGINGINSILSYSRKRFTLPDNQNPILVETTPEREAQAVISWKLMDWTWKVLETLWQ